MYIHEIENWTSFRWDAAQLAHTLEKTGKSIGFLFGRLSTIGFDQQMSATVESVTHEVVASSEIEGIILNTEEVRSSVARKLGVTVPNSKEPTHYIDGVVEMMLDAVMNYDVSLTSDRLFNWHAALFPNGRSGSIPITVGAYRTEVMEVVSGTFGRERVHYRAPAPERLAEEMQIFLQWFNNPDIAPSLIKSAIAHFWFVCIHPFDDGNGRIARAISDMVLSQIDRSKLRFFSMSMQINRDKKEYYRILEQTQRGTTDITAWLKWYLDCLNAAVKESNTLLSGVLNKAVFWRTHTDVSISDRQRTLLNHFLDGYDGKLTAKNWSKLADVSPDTAGRDIKDLVAKGIITAVQGRVRDVSYTLNYSKVDKNRADFKEAAVVSRADGDYITAIYRGEKVVEEKITQLDKVRIEQEEITIDDLTYKYFAYLIDL